jgi:shikimate kinase
VHRPFIGVVLEQDQESGSPSNEVSRSSGETPEAGEGSRRDKRSKEYLLPNIILVGSTGSGKSTVGWHLARLLGYGFIDTDSYIAKKIGKSVTDIFANGGETAFRAAEKGEILGFNGIRCHVIAPGGGALTDQESWNMLRILGVTVWLNSPVEEIARRLLRSPQELQARPLLKEVLTEKDLGVRSLKLIERLKAMIGQRISRYKEAQFMIEDPYSTPESTATQIKQLLIKNGVLKLPSRR